MSVWTTWIAIGPDGSVIAESVKGQRYGEFQRALPDPAAVILDAPQAERDYPSAMARWHKERTA